MLQASSIYRFDSWSFAILWQIHYFKGIFDNHKVLGCNAAGT